MPLDARGQEVWTRCFKTPVEVHHRLTRARGGNVLDALGETYHLLALCPGHHRAAHLGGSAAFDGGLLLDGAILRVGDAHHYTGTDPYLAARFGLTYGRERARV